MVRLVVSLGHRAKYYLGIFIDQHTAAPSTIQCIHPPPCFTKGTRTYYKKDNVKVVETGEFKIWTEDFMDACDGRLPPSQELKECESYTKLVQGMRETWKDGKVIRTEKGTFGRDMQVVEQ